MRKLMIVSLLFLLLVACQNKGNTEDAQQGEEIPTSQEKEDIPPVYLDETNYTGDELEIVKLMNARVRYLYEKDEKAYMNLFDPQSPISGMGRYKIRKITSISDIIIQEQKQLYQGAVTITELRENDKEYISTMVFWKKKEDGDNAQWVIADID
ncbi:hypothetical protein BK131_01210 [Paenibacillus amylolyticus]|uniref:DUF4829 domain-containing protein n=1 Tax=Paenibacillus amylolyticus TaxID=1451 RepID=A0A1R1C3F8_PAEAM|nr:hypothetical protein [Paenibacillus amylolyticus]OMF16646.1 hypothetical protein BK131_01210 [Paenibacillus amylolyticus]